MIYEAPTGTFANIHQRRIAHLRVQVKASKRFGPKVGLDFGLQNELLNPQKKSKSNRFIYMFTFKGRQMIYVRCFLVFTCIYHQHLDSNAPNMRGDDFTTLCHVLGNQP